ncbi:MAG: DUF1730 domain-containing protein [Oscillospiraceae bacterium]|jgi:epoxyqueuosine reductase|nr:DUF1730 domain-containing protein [Oscillospiraceae bacterium]
MDLASRLDALLPLWGICAWDASLPLRETRAPAPCPLPPAACLVAAFPYRLPEACYPGRNLSRYAVPPDYHRIVGARLAAAGAALAERFPGAAFPWFCDNSPLPEVALAEQAGLGRRGCHHLLITERFGSWVFLGTLASSLPAAELRLALGRPAPGPLPDPCENCAAGDRVPPCRRACPAGALEAGGFRRERCLSFLSQRKGDLDSRTALLLRRAGTVWGCDLCQEACPRGRAAELAPLPEFTAGLRPRLEPDCLDPASLTGRAYAWRGRAVLERNLSALEPRSTPRQPADQKNSAGDKISADAPEPIDKEPPSPV